MKKYSGSVLLIAITAALFCGSVSCRRKAVHKEHPEFIGTWHHRESNGESWTLVFGKKSWGTITVYDANGKDKQLYGENGRRWRFKAKNMRLYNGLISPVFNVDQLPETATVQIINQLDTINTGRTYCIINGDYFLKNQ